MARSTRSLSSYLENYHRKLSPDSRQLARYSLIPGETRSVPLSLYAKFAKKKNVFMSFFMLNMLPINERD